MAGGRRKTRKLKGGMGYGFGGKTIGTSGAQWDSSWGGEVTKAGAPVYDTADPQRGSSRRRKSRKMTKKTKKSRRKMRGGLRIATVGAAFTGNGSRGLASYEPYPSSVGGPARNPDGVQKA